MPLSDTDGHVQLIPVDQDVSRPILLMSRETVIGLKNLQRALGEAGDHAVATPDSQAMSNVRMSA
jgi:hypothetical protein